MRTRVIREAILEAHQNVDKYGGTWYVLNSDFFDVVKESYFIHEDGTRKDKPFVSLYNTDDKFYGRSGIGHIVEYKDGDLIFTSSWDKPEWDNFEQPYGDKVTQHDKGERGIKPIIMGDVHIGKSMSSAMIHALSLGTHADLMEIIAIHDKLEDEGIGGILSGLNQLGENGMRDTFKKTFVVNNYCDYFKQDESDSVKPKMFDMATGKMIDVPITGSISESKRLALRKKRKKRGK